MCHFKSTSLMAFALICCTSAIGLAQMNVGINYTVGVYSLYSFKYRYVNQLTIPSEANYVITASTDNYTLPPVRNPRPGMRRIHSFNCHFSTINVKSLDGTILQSVNFPDNYSTSNQTVALEVSLPPGVYNIEFIGIVNGRATSGLGHRGMFYLKTTAK